MAFPLLLSRYKSLDGSGVVFSLPYSINFSTQPNGPLPSDLLANASTWAISSGVAVCTPATLGSEVLTDPGLEGNYTAGLNDSLTESGSGTYTEETTTIHGGTSAQKAVWGANLDQLNWATALNVDDHAFYRFSTWVKKGSGGGTTGVRWRGSSMGVGSGRINVTGDWTQYIGATLCGATFLLNIGCLTAGDVGAEIYVDDGSVKKLTTSELIAMLPASQADVTVKASFNTTSPQHNYHHGVIARANSRTAPTTYLLAVIDNADASIRVDLHKVVNGTITYLTGAYIGLTGQRLVEIRTSGSTVQLFYNGVQQGTDQTVSDVPVTNNIHGFISSGGGNSLNSFFVG